MSTSSLIELLSTCFAFSGKNPRMPNGRILLWPMWDAKANTSRFHCSDIVWALPSAISTINTGSPRGANCCCQPHGRHAAAGAWQESQGSPLPLAAWRTCMHWPCATHSSPLLERHLWCIFVNLLANSVWPFSQSNI